jgi:hypothetical protein
MASQLSISIALPGQVSAQVSTGRAETCVLKSIDIFIQFIKVVKCKQVSIGISFARTKIVPKIV